MERALFAGLGSIGRRHLRLLRDRPESVDVHAYRSGQSDRPTPDGVTEHSTLSAALDAEPDVAFVTNPTSLHVETALECARSGCDLFVEKPLSDSMRGVDDLVLLADEEELVNYVGCVLRFHPVLQVVRDRLRRGTVGAVRSFRAYSGSHLPDWRKGQDYRTSYSAKADLGGGVVLDMIHEIDYTYWLFGDVASVMGWTGNVSDLDISTEDLAEIVIETTSGQVGAIHLDYYRPVARRTLEVVGSDAVLRAQLGEGRLVREDPDGKEIEDYEVDMDDIYAEQLDHFLSHVRDGTPCENDLRTAARVLEIALDAKRS